MNFVEWFNTMMKRRNQKLLSDNNRKETNQNNSLGEQRKSFFNRLHKPVSNDASKNIERETILRDLATAVIVKEEFPPYNLDYDHEEFRKIITAKDKKFILTNEERNILFFIKNAICDGNDLLQAPRELVNRITGCLNSDKNVINEFLKESHNNLLVLIDLIKQNAKTLLEDDYFGSRPSNYTDIANLIEEYNRNKEMGIE